jgi:ABC-type lipoprotein export system ATPase subunit
MAILRLDHVSKEYRAERDTVRALDGVSLSVAEGEFVSLVGRSGCGKSTLLNLAGAMDFPTSGRVFLDGTETSRLDDAALTAVRRTKIGFVFQFFQLLPTLSVIENVELPLLLQGNTNGRGAALERLRWVEMEGFAERLAHQLSGGQMQRAAIARALVTAPRLILADEPIGNLDSASAGIVMQLLRRASSELATTILMATHSLEAAAVSDTIVRLRDGQIEEISRN